MIIVWILIATTIHGYSPGVVTVVGQFGTENDCAWVASNMRHDYYTDLRCIKSRILVPGISR